MHFESSVNKQHNIYSTTVHYMQCNVVAYWCNITSLAKLKGLISFHLKRVLLWWFCHLQQ